MNHQFFIYVPYSGGGGWVALELSGWALLASQLSSHPYLPTYKIWKHTIQDFLSYRIHEVLSADAA